jgi:hypothetical protein
MTDFGFILILRVALRVAGDCERNARDDEGGARQLDVPRHFHLLPGERVEER